jgi:ribonuclease BN (tRNA processing enzyme)
MRVHLIGTGTAVPDPNHTQTCTLVSTDDGGSTIVVDLGGGAINRIPGWDRVSAWFFTHDHPDHTGGLDQLIQSHLYGRMEIPLDDVPPPLRLFAPPSVLDLLDEIRDRHFNGTSSRERLDGSLRTETIADGTAIESLPGFRIECFDSGHTEDSVSLRIEADGKVFTLTSDASTSGKLMEVLDGADAALIECSLPPEIEMPSHLNGKQVGSIIAAMGDRAPGKIILTHLYPPAMEKKDSIRKSFSSRNRNRIGFARDGQSIRI